MPIGTAPRFTLRACRIIPTQSTARWRPRLEPFSAAVAAIRARAEKVGRRVLNVRGVRR